MLAQSDYLVQPIKQVHSQTQKELQHNTCSKHVFWQGPGNMKGVYHVLPALELVRMEYAPSLM